MVRRLAALVAAALLVSAVLPGSLAAADPKGTKLSKEDHVQLAKAAAATMHSKSIATNTFAFGTAARCLTAGQEFS